MSEPGIKRSYKADSNGMQNAILSPFRLYRSDTSYVKKFCKKVSYTIEKNNRRPSNDELRLFLLFRTDREQKTNSVHDNSVPVIGDFKIYTTRHISRVLLKTAIFLDPSSPRGSSHLDGARRASGISPLCGVASDRVYIAAWSPTRW